MLHRITGACVLAALLSPSALAAHRKHLKHESSVQTLSHVVQHQSDGGAVDINQASQQRMTQIPGLGEKRAAAIVQYRQQHGPFKSLSELARVKGVGKKRIALWQKMPESGPHLVVGEAT